jgi:hypothetical protein
MRKTSQLPAGLPGIAASPVDKAVPAVDGDNGVLYVRHPGKLTWWPIGSPELWRFRAARYTQHGWWCDEADHLRCTGCNLDAELRELQERLDRGIAEAAVDSDLPRDPAGDAA